MKKGGPSLLLIWKCDLIFSIIVKTIWQLIDAQKTVFWLWTSMECNQNKTNWAKMNNREMKNDA